MLKLVEASDDQNHTYQKVGAQKDSLAPAHIFHKYSVNRKGSTSTYITDEDPEIHLIKCLLQKTEH